MFPRIKKSARKSGVYEYLVISESVRDGTGRSTTRDIARLGNVARFDQRSVKGLIDGLIRLFEVDEYGLTDQVDILELRGVPSEALRIRGQYARPDHRGESRASTA